MSFSLRNELLPGKRHDRRRRHQRYRGDFPLTATVLSEKGYLVLQGRCSDIAEGGMGGHSDQSCGTGGSADRRLSTPTFAANDLHSQQS